MHQIFKIVSNMKELKVFYKKNIPFKGYCAITLFDHMIIREDCRDKVGKRTCNHEKIHQAQSRDFGLGFCGYFIFYFLYLLEWILKLPWALFGYKPYESISFEREAYIRDCDFSYLEKRKRFAWVKYIFKMIK